jgi:3-dehydroquinate synthase
MSMLEQMSAVVSREEVRAGEEGFPYYFGHGCLTEFDGVFASLDADMFMVVSDDRVMGLHGQRLLDLLVRIAPTRVLSAAPGEQLKHGSRVVEWLDAAIAFGATRRSVVVTFGGGVPGNLGGVVAGLLYRGVRLVHVPTTTVSAMDSVISLKQAVNTPHGKNQIGLYHSPVAVCCDLELLATLPGRERRSGLGEALKNCLAIRPDKLSVIGGLLDADDWTSPDLLTLLLVESLAAKAEVMKHDSHEQKSGLVLEYGHTVGHAIELCDAQTRGDDAMSHGEAIALGMCVAARISHARGHLDAASVAVHDRLVSALGVPFELPPGCDPATVTALLRRDNKRGYLKLDDDQIAMVLLRALGSTIDTDGLPLTPVDIDEVALHLPPSHRAT